jgi:hypothetical protein
VTPAKNNNKQQTNKTSTTTYFRTSKLLGHGINNFGKKTSSLTIKYAFTLFPKYQGAENKIFFIYFNRKKCTLTVYSREPALASECLTLGS